MKFLISYFYQVRFMKPYMLPISTAKWDPKWYHQNKDSSYTFIDKNGVLNGLRAEPFSPGEECSYYCVNCQEKTLHCTFLEKYREQLDSLDFSKLMDRFKDLASRCSDIYDWELHEPVFVLLIHEAPSNPCSERRVLKEYFKAHGIELLEFNKSENYD